MKEIVGGASAARQEENDEEGSKTPRHELASGPFCLDAVRTIGATVQRVKHVEPGARGGGLKEDACGALGIRRARRGTDALSPWGSA
jgi:hypothetical protein